MYMLFSVDSSVSHSGLVPSEAIRTWLRWRRRVLEGYAAGKGTGYLSW